MRLALLLLVIVSGCTTPQPTSSSEPERPWLELLREAELAQGPNVLLTSLADDFYFFNTTTVADVKIQLTADGGEAQSYIFPPGCAEIECAEFISTANAPADWTATTTDPGTWEIHVSKADPGAAPVPFTLVALARDAST